MIRVVEESSVFYAYEFTDLDKGLQDTAANLRAGDLVILADSLKKVHDTLDIPPDGIIICTDV